ncbi:MAG: hypothetical protein HYU77_09640 [Betaproteobacteria bacterium]|nr:hypothetical protein [Betaproteobacteria bacterium]
MVLVRLLGFLFLIAIALCVVLFLFTKDRKYLKWGRRVFQFGIVFALVLAALYLVERIILII